MAIGFPVPQAVPGRGDLQPDTIPAGSYATALNVGPYDTLRQTYDALFAWMGQQSYVPTGPAYEFYLNDPGEVTPEEIQTRIAMPVKTA